MVQEAKEAFQRLKETLENDAETAYGWHSVIAMCMEDELMQNKSSDASVICNDAASRAMKMLFGIETSRNMLLDEPEKQ